MLLIDLTHTSHTAARTGVQRVVRSLYESLRKGGGVEAITHDPYEKIWRRLRAWEFANLRRDEPARTRGARWPWAARISGQLRRSVSGNTELAAADGLIVPEIFSATTASQFPRLWKSVKGPKIALFHDAIALKFPELTPAKTVTRFPLYLQELLLFDGIAAVSEDSRQALLDYWNWLGASHRPVVRTIPLGSTPVSPNLERSPAPSGKTCVILSVGSIEGRKNHLTLLDACEKLWEKGLRFQLRLVGLPQPETGKSALQRISELQHANRDLRYDGAISDRELDLAYTECAFTVYPSLMEGFGLPVLESVYRGKPCICSAHGALGEAAQGGGCLTWDPREPATLSGRIELLLTDASLREKIGREARLRPPRGWDVYTAELKDWFGEFPSLPS